MITYHPHGVGGMQRHTFDLVRGLVDSGNEVEVIAPRGDHATDNRKEGARWRFVDIERRKERFGRWLDKSLAEFSRTHSARSFDVVHSESTSALGLVGRIDIPVVVKFHGNYVGLAKACFRRGLQRSPLRELKSFIRLTRLHFGARGRNCWAFRDCEWMVPAQQQFADTRRSHVMRADRGHFVPNGVDADLFRPLSRPARNEPVLVAVGRLGWQKGFDVAIRALADIPRAHLRIVGNGDQRGSLERLAHQLGVAERVEFVGHLPPQGVAREIAEGDIFLFPTRREEAAPLVLVEAMACGVPVIASQLGGIPEVIDRPGANGILVPSGDPAVVAEATNGLLASEEKRKAMGAGARERILADYTLSRMIQRTLEVYGRAIEREAKASAASSGAGD